MKALAAKIESLNRSLGWLGQTALVFMTLSICYDVVMRYVFAMPTDWALEINTFLVIFITLIPAGDVLRDDGHLNITLLTCRLSPATQTFLRKLAGGVGVLFCALMIWKGVGMVWQAYSFDQRMSTALGTPMCVPYLFIPLGFLALGLQFFLRLLGADGKSK